MKKFLRVFALALFVAVAGVALAACGGKKEEELKPADFVGKWEVESTTITFEGGNTQTYTLAEFKHIHDNWDDHDEADRALYSDYLFYDFLKFEITAEGKIGRLSYYDTEEGGYVECGDWAIEHNQLLATLPGWDCTAEYTNGKIVVTITDVGELHVLTIGKVAA